LHETGFARVLKNLWNGLARLSRFDGTIEGEATEVPLVTVPALGRFADDRWLVVATRAAPGEANGFLYTPTGISTGAAALGDGVSHVCCAPDGTIWVGYFDEGIYCDQNDDNSWAKSAAGIANLAPDGTLLWSFNASQTGNLLIDDCYAMTLSGNTLWACCYSDFPIVRIQAGTISRWSNTVGGARALAVDSNYILLAGGYGEDRNKLTLLRLEDGEAHLIGELRSELLSTATFAQGQADTLHIVGQGRWARVTVADARAALEA